MATRARRQLGREWTTQARDGLTDGMFSAMRDKAQQDLGRHVSVGAESEADLVGLPLPALSLRYLFQSTVFPLGRITQITGQEGSAKSLFLYEIYRWHMKYGGGSIHMENENKDTSDLRHSVLNYNPQWLARTHMVPSDSLEDWQEAMSYYLRLLRETMDTPGGPGKTVPTVLGIDSLMGTSPREEFERVMKDGHASRSFALAALLISQYMRTFPRQLRGYPISVVGTNHLKPSTDARGLPSSTTPGGKSVKFYETFEIEMRPAQDRDISRTEYEGLRVQLIAKKNGFGPSRKRIQAEVLWWYDESDGTFRQRTAWDWNAATVSLVLSLASANGKRAMYDALTAVCDLRKATGSKVWSRTLGIPEGESLEFREAGAMIEQRPDILHEWNKILGIKERKVFQPGMDYQALLQAAVTEATTRTAEAYAPVAISPSVHTEADTFDASDVPESEMPSDQEDDEA